MKKNLFVFAAGLFTGILAMWLVGKAGHKTETATIVAKTEPAVCYSCFWEGYPAKLHSDLIEYYRQYRNPDPLVSADARYILWRTTGTPNCDVRSEYRGVVRNDVDSNRRFAAGSILGFGASECGDSGSKDFQAAAEAAGEAGLNAEAGVLRALSDGKFAPKFEETKITTAITVPPSASRFTLGESRIEVSPNMRVGTQVDRVARDWISYQMKWNLSGNALPATYIQYHEGALVQKIMEKVPAQFFPLTGALVAKNGEKWYGMDETGTFRFQVLTDKIRYPTTHVSDNAAWIEDTHGISALVAQAVERKMDLVIGCGDSEGKAQAAYYLAQKGINVVFPGDRYQDLLLGYTGKGVLLGTAPVHDGQSGAVIGGQPVTFALNELIVVEDTKKNFPLQYYDAGARYFRKLSNYARLNLEYVEVDDADQIDRVLKIAQQKHASAVGVRVVMENENEKLRAWLSGSPKNRAVLFHSGLYPFAQPLFKEFPKQVTFGDLHPRFE